MGYDITEEIDQKCEDLYGHTDWKFGKNNEVIIFPEARICYLADKHFDCSCGDDDEAKRYACLHKSFLIMSVVYLFPYNK